jgi:hypothetical protein
VQVKFSPRRRHFYKQSWARSVFGWVAPGSFLLRCLWTYIFLRQRQKHLHQKDTVALELRNNNLSKQCIFKQETLLSCANERTIFYLSVVWQTTIGFE